VPPLLFVGSHLIHITSHFPHYIIPSQEKEKEKEKEEEALERNPLRPPLKPDFNSP